MGKIKKVSIVALLLLLVGIVGSLLTFKPIIQQNSISKEKVINEKFSHIEIVTGNTGVEILPTTDSTAKIDISGKVGKGSNYNLSTNVENSTLSIGVKYEQRSLINFFPSSLSLKVYLPEMVYESIQIKGDDGGINTSDLQAKDINIKTANGKIKLSNVKGTTVTTQAIDGASNLKNVTASIVNVKSGNGKIELSNVKGTTVTTQAIDGASNFKNVTASNMNVKSYNGRINLENIEGHVSAKANDGSILLVSNHLDNPIEFETDNGSIDIQTKKKPTNATINVSVENGKVDIFDSSNRNVVFGNGEHLIKLTATDGSITVEKK